MAYTGSSLSLIAGSIEGTVNFFGYVTSDPIATALGVDYFLDGDVRGMQVGDLIVIIAQNQAFMCYCSAASEAGCTASAAALALINGNGFPTTPPPAGSGIIWNNGTFLCVA